MSCAFCGGKVERIKSRGEPFKYCSPECDKAAMSLRLRTFVSRVLTVRRALRGDGWKTLRLDCGHIVDILIGEGEAPQTIKCQPCKHGVTGEADARG